MSQLQKDQQTTTDAAVKHMEQKSTLPAYVLVTPSRNEEALIASTIESVIHQTVLPCKWVIVNDG